MKHKLSPTLYFIFQLIKSILWIPVAISTIYVLENYLKTTSSAFVLVGPLIASIIMLYDITPSNPPLFVVQSDRDVLTASQYICPRVPRLRLRYVPSSQPTSWTQAEFIEKTGTRKHRARFGRWLEESDWRK